MRVRLRYVEDKMKLQQYSLESNSIFSATRRAMLVGYYSTTLARDSLVSSPGEVDIFQLPSFPRRNLY